MGRVFTMWGGAVFIIAALAQVSGDTGEIFDVTTVYQVADLFKSDNESETIDVVGRIHLRSNARGLVLYDTNDNKIPTISPNSPLAKLTCVMGTPDCLWTHQGWLVQYDYAHCSSGHTKCATSTKCIEFAYICDGADDCGDRSDEVSCTSINNYNTKRGFFRCRTGQILSSHSKLCDFVVDCTDGSDESNCYDDSGNGELVSPPIDPAASQFGLMLAYTSQGHTALDILARDEHSTEHKFYTFNDDNDGFSIRHINVTIPDNIGEPINIIIRKTAPFKLKIQVIHAYNVIGTEDVQVLSEVALTSSRSSYKSQLPIYTVASDYNKTANPVPDANDTCMHGGVWTDAGRCACLPGFSGSFCEQRCGKNRFGHDCGSKCSLHESACAGMLLCTPYTGCHCAAGHSGPSCELECAPSAYGADCEQRCGHCASDSPCDVNTGECTACEPGYQHPYCVQPTVYYAAKPQLSSDQYGTVTVSFDPHDYQPVDEAPQLYQIQYREFVIFPDYQWSIYTTKSINNSDQQNSSFYSEVIDGLKTGILYEVRVLFLDANFNKHDGDFVKTSAIMTKCYIPEEYDYQVRSTSNASAITFSWTYANLSEHWCPLRRYEVSWMEDWETKTDYAYEDTLTLTELLPGSTVAFRVSALTFGGSAPYSKQVTASTLHSGSLAVKRLRVVSSDSSSVRVAWAPPLDPPNSYSVSYKCVEQPACAPGCVNATEGVVTVGQPGATLTPLLPFAQYLVTVTPEGGVSSSMYAGTTKVPPTETPSLSSRRPERSNTSLTVFWDQQPVCSSFLLGYNYQLLKESDSLKVLASGFTKDSSVTFHNLTASTDYEVRVFVTTLAGWNPQAFLAISTSTSATVPEAVRELTVYKRGRGLLGVRWAAPRATYGDLQSFTVSHSLGLEQQSHTVGLTPCTVWPDLYCHTLEGLRANRNYRVTVSARNVDVPEDGVATSVIGSTRETPPTAPENLKVMNRTAETVELQWSYPNLANGILRYFLVSVEETEQFDQDACCQDYPLVETPVEQELQVYTTQVSGLHPASTYFVSVSAKTVGLGPSQSLVVYTRPPPLAFTVLPQLQYNTDDDISWLPQQPLPQLNNSDLYTALIKAHFLLAVSKESQVVSTSADSGIMDSQLDALLRHMITDPFFFVTEYKQDQEVFLGEGEEENESVWGRLPSPSPLTAGQRYQLVAVQVTEHNGAYNADLRYTNTFTLLS